MKTFLLRRVVFQFTGLLWFLLGCFNLQAQEISAKLRNPFLLPQTSFYLGSVNYTVSFPNSSITDTFNLSNDRFNVYGFDVEVNANPFTNIGGYFRVESLSGNRQPISNKFSTLIGGFTRFFYIPPFLNTGTVTTNAFARLELGIGPTILGLPSGIAVQGGAYFGAETYLTKWLGASVSYGQIFELGKDTLNLPSEFKGVTIWSHGRMLLVSLKTTFF